MGRRHIWESDDLKLGKWFDLCLFLEGGIIVLVPFFVDFPGGSVVKNLPAMQETWVQSLDQADLLEKGMTTHSRILAWRIPMDRGPWRATVQGVTKSQIQLK